MDSSCAILKRPVSTQRCSMPPCTKSTATWRKAPWSSVRPNHHPTPDKAPVSYQDPWGVADVATPQDPHSKWPYHEPFPSNDPFYDPNPSPNQPSGYPDSPPGDNYVSPGPPKNPDPYIYRDPLPPDIYQNPNTLPSYPYTNQDPSQPDSNNYHVPYQSNQNTRSNHARFQSNQNKNNSPFQPVQNNYPAPFQPNRNRNQAPFHPDQRNPHAPFQPNHNRNDGPFQPGHHNSYPPFLHEKNLNQAPTPPKANSDHAHFNPNLHTNHVTPFTNQERIPRPPDNAGSSSNSYSGSNPFINHDPSNYANLNPNPTNIHDHDTYFDPSPIYIPPKNTDSIQLPDSPNQSQFSNYPDSSPYPNPYHHPDPSHHPGPSHHPARRKFVAPPYSYDRAQYLYRSRRSVILAHRRPYRDGR